MRAGQAGPYMDFLDIGIIPHIYMFGLPIRATRGRPYMGFSDYGFKLAPTLNFNPKTGKTSPNRLGRWIPPGPGRLFGRSRD